MQRMEQQATKEELTALVEKMRDANKRVYWHFFHQGFGTDCHAFLEFCGLMSKYEQLCGECARKGIDFRHLNTHSGEAIPMAEHDVLYLAEKFDCIFGSFFKQRPEMARLFAREALGLEEGR